MILYDFQLQEVNEEKGLYTNYLRNFENSIKNDPKHSDDLGMFFV